ncbi:MAG TPA: hypothetical protein PKA42_00405 [Candidatus Paceibacterota bacterium]|nr:hypothetical protein [Candidatus Paceibacterota bacterium]HMO82606.1 hypothetical protein [Candidatus Paceibacterota bacterium]
MIFLNRDEEEENPDDEEATLAEDLLDEVGEEAVADDELEGFGLITPELEKEEEEEEKIDEDEAILDEDAEDVDFDTFDDVDEL